MEIGTCWFVRMTRVCVSFPSLIIIVCHVSLLCLSLPNESFRWAPVYPNASTDHKADTSVDCNDGSYRFCLHCKTKSFVPLLDYGLVFVTLWLDDLSFLLCLLGCLFDIEQDPSEYHDLSVEKPDLLRVCVQSAWEKSIFFFVLIIRQILGDGKFIQTGMCHCIPAFKNW